MAELVEELAAVPEYRQRFGSVFGGEISGTTIARALAAFERSLLTFNAPYDRFQAGDKRALAAFERSLLTFNAPYDRFQAGDTRALTKEQQEGLAIFNGKAACSACHVPPLFIDQRFHALGVPQSASAAEDPGRFAVTGDEADRGAFRTPTLRNLTLTAPSMHNGALATLDDVIAFYDAGGGPVPGRPGPAIGPLHLTPLERKALVAFLVGLTDPGTNIGSPAIP